MPWTTQTTSKSRSVVPSWQDLSFLMRLVALTLIAAIGFVGKVNAQLFDALDAHPPRWSLDTSDCDARVIQHKHLADGGYDERSCESITFQATNGSEAIFVYPIEPVAVIDDLNASLYTLSAKPGVRIGFRVRYPYARDEETRRPLHAYVFGAAYSKTGEFQKIGVGIVEKAVRLRTIALRQEHGSAADLADPYVDAVVINGFTGPGTTAVRIDDLHIDGLLPIGQNGHVPRSRSEADFAKERSAKLDINSDARLNAVFPTGKVTKILQHNGEPLNWVRTLGFDGVLLSRPPTAAILREAIQSRLLIYAPPPTAPDRDLQSLLEPIAAWYIGSGLSLDRRRVDQTRLTAERLRGFPARWQRPIVAAPTESWRQYSPLVDALIDDLPPRLRSVTPREEVAEMITTQSRVTNQVQVAAGIASMPPERALQQAQVIANSIGAPPPSVFRWHAMWLQAMRSLETTPSAILFRSSRSLSSGMEIDSQRAMSLSYVNRMISMVAPWVSGSSPATPLPIAGGNYRCGRIQQGETDVLIISSTAIRGNEVLAGDGAAIDILLPPEDAAKNAWRATDFSAERIASQTTAEGTRLQIVSPDAVEVVVLSSDPSVGGRLATSAARFAQQAGLDRWQLTQDLVDRTRRDWNAAVESRATTQANPTDLLSVARQTLVNAEPLYRAGDVGASIRMARRADAWALRSRWQLSEALMPDWPNPTSCPSMQCSAMLVQIGLQPLMRDEGWGRNRMTTGSLDRPEVLAESRWTFGKRLDSTARSEVSFVTRGMFAGPGALRARVAAINDDPLLGGYEGTAMQISSPSVRVPKGKAFRIDAMVRTLGFGGPHQGVLVYDTVGGQELGVLVRGESTWTPIRLYRQAIGDQEVKVMFEVIGAGEVMVDEVRLQIWEPKGQQFLPIQPIAERNEADSETTRR